MSVSDSRAHDQRRGRLPEPGEEHQCVHSDVVHHQSRRGRRHKPLDLGIPHPSDGTRIRSVRGVTGPPRSPRHGHLSEHPVRVEGDGYGGGRVQ